MIEKILELLEKVWTLATPIVMMHPWQGVVITRFGRHNRTKGPGYWLKMPLLEDYVLYEECETTMRLPPQSLVTKDDVPVVVSSIVKYEIRDGQKFVCNVWDAKDVLADVTMGAIAKCVQKHTYSELMQGEPEAEVLTMAKRGTSKYGFQVNQLTFTDRCRARSLRLVLPNAKDLDN